MVFMGCCEFVMGSNVHWKVGHPLRLATGADTIGATNDTCCPLL
jgi:hypothetical protein